MRGSIVSNSSAELNGIEPKPTGQGLRAALQIDPTLRLKYEQDGWWADDTLARWMATNVVRAGDRAACVTAEGSLSYRELADKAERFARGLYDLGIRAGDVVSIQLPNTPEFLIAYFGITRLGAVVSTVHQPYRIAEIRTLVSHGPSVAFIGHGGNSPIAEILALKEELPTLKHIIVIGDQHAGAIPFNELMKSGPPLPAEVIAHPSDPFLLLFTSGTSAGPKAVPLSYQITLGNARVGVIEHGFQETDTVLSVASYTHLLGLYCLHLTTRAGASNILFPSFTPAELSAAITHNRPSVLVCAAPHLAAMMVNGLLETTDFSSIRLIITSGSALSPTVAKEVSARLSNGFLTNLWGMTELQAGTYTRPGDPFEIATNTSGRAAPGAEIRIADTKDIALPAGTEGELQIRGSLLFPGYYKNDAANRLSFTDDGWFRTGDLAEMDVGGNIRITGRKTEVINRGGMKYNPLDVENIIATYPKVAEVAIVPYPDPVLGQRACCFIVPRGHVKLTLEELCTHLLERGVSKVKLPERLELIEEMPVTPTRKIMKGRLKERLTG